jgi:hypothetical protein
MELFSLSLTLLLKGSVFALGRILQIGLMFATKTGAYPCEVYSTLSGKATRLFWKHSRDNYPFEAASMKKKKNIV